MINADDYYGAEAFVRVHDFLEHYSPERPNEFCMAGFILKNTLSENGGVTSGVCSVDADGMLTGIEETSNIVKGRCQQQLMHLECHTYILAVRIVEQPACKGTQSLAPPSPMSAR